MLKHFPENSERNIIERPKRLKNKTGRSRIFGSVLTRKSSNKIAVGGDPENSRGDRGFASEESVRGGGLTGTGTAAVHPITR